MLWVAWSTLWRTYFFSNYIIKIVQLIYVYCCLMCIPPHLYALLLLLNIYLMKLFKQPAPPRKRKLAHITLRNHVSSCHLPNELFLVSIQHACVEYQHILSAIHIPYQWCHRYPTIQQQSKRRCKCHNMIIWARLLLLLQLFTFTHNAYALPGTKHVLISGGQSGQSQRVRRS